MAPKERTTRPDCPFPADFPEFFLVALLELPLLAVFVDFVDFVDFGDFVVFEGFPDFLRAGLLEERLVVAREDPMPALYLRGTTRPGTETRTSYTSTTTGMIMGRRR